VKRRDFISLVGGAATWPLAARAQQAERMRRVGILSGVGESDPDALARYGAFRRSLQQLGWIEGRNVRFDSWFGSAGNPELVRKSAAELLALSPDVILAAGSPNVRALQEANRNVPIVFAGVVDPVGTGLVQSLARPGGNTTGFIAHEYGLSVKWLELLKEIAPSVTRVGVIRELTNPVGIGIWAAMQGAAPFLKVELSPVDLRDAGDIERLIAMFAGGGPSGGLIVIPTGLILMNRDLISSLAARHRLPAVYSFRYLVTGGGLISYGPDPVDVLQRAAGYVDRILRGEKPADLPVQAPTKYELVINLKTARALGLEVLRADELIE
jgi:putative tryptophan/tyrosine transport system substrate-binding protein